MGCSVGWGVRGPRSDRLPKAGQLLTIKRVVHPSTSPLAADEPDIEQDLHVLRHRRLDFPYRPDEIADADFTIGCSGKNAQQLKSHPGKRYLDWELDDPAGKPIDVVRPIVEEIDRRTRALLADLLDETQPER